MLLMKLHRFATLLVLAAVSGLACRGTDGGDSGAQAQSPPPRPEAEAERLAADVGWLAADERQGRRAGTAGEGAAARWIAARFEQLGLEPLGTDGYFQEFSVPLPVKDEGGSFLRGRGAHGGELSFVGEGYVRPLFCSAGAEVRGPLVFAGYGVERPEMNWNDFEGLELEGAVVLVVRGVPPGPGQRPAADGGTGPAASDTGDAGETSRPAQDSGAGAAGASGEAAHGDDTQITSAEAGWGNSGSIFHKVMECKRRGAAGVLLVNPPETADEPLLEFEQGRTAQAGIPALMISPRLISHLLLDYERRLAELHRWGSPFYDPPPPGEELYVGANVSRKKGLATNVLARLPGRSSARTVVIGAHFDHLGHGDMGSRAPDAIGTIHNGADDNASGTAVVLELARMLRAYPEAPAGDVIFALWSGEELGLLGSEHWAANPTIDWDSVIANYNLDMVGRAGDGHLEVLGAGTAAPFAGWLSARGPEVGLDLAISASGQGVGGSDHQSFLKRGVPSLHFFSGIHPEYHMPTDDVELFEADGAARTADLLFMLVEDVLRTPKQALAYLEPEVEETDAAAAERAGGFRSHFGSVPEYGFEGPGVLLGGTTPGSPAERAGLLGGDLLVGLGDVEIESIYDLVYALQRYKPGDVVEARYIRDGQEERVRVTLLSRSLE